jgi:hypothetical protein
MVGLELIIIQEVPEKVTGRANPRSKWVVNTTLSGGSGAGIALPAGSRHDTPAEMRRVLVIHSMSAGVTSDPSQPERPYDGAVLLSSGAEVAVILEEAIVLAGIGRESRSPIVLVLTEEDKGGKLVSPGNRSHTC